MTALTKPTVFISYSHKDEDWKNRLLPQLRVLEQAGRIVVWDDRKIDGGDDWYPEIKAAMEHAAIAICLISSDYLASDFCVKEEVPFLLQRREHDGMIFIPILVRPCAWKAFEWLKEIQMLPRDGKSIVVDFRGVEDAVFSEVANLVLNCVDNPIKCFLPATAPSLWPVPTKIDLTRLPVTGVELFGRQRELELLDEAWESDQSSIVSLVAWGGVGKSTLINKWLERMKGDNYRGAEYVYGWSFYSHGTGDRVTSADQFINHALAWFGDLDPTAGSPWDKGERLAKLAQGHKTLLVLDGLEPLQSGSPFDRGNIKDPALITFLGEFAQAKYGLCLISTREALTDLDEFASRVVQLDLEQISKQAGRALLRVGGIRGTDSELEQVSGDFGNHALAINLLTAYLHEIPEHEASGAADIPDLSIPENEGKHPRRVMAALAKRFGDGPEVEILKMLGLFDRPVDKASLRALRNAPVIPGLSNHIRKLSEASWRAKVEELRKYKLIAPQSQHRPDYLDSHPLVREHFGHQLRTDHFDAWRSGNNRIYNYLKRSTKVFPDNLEQMTPLYAAVTHGCAAGKYDEVIADVYYARILRKTVFYTKVVLGAYSSDLAALTNFYSSPWQPVPELSARWKGFLLNDTGWTLNGLGRPVEAVQLIEAAIEIAATGNQANVTAAAISLSEIKLTIGDIQGAFVWVSRAEEGAIDGSRRRAATYAKAHVLFQAGRIPEAELAYKAADNIAIDKLKETQAPQIVYFFAPSQFCDLLLYQGRYNEALIHAKRIIEGAVTEKNSLQLGLGYLSLARAQLRLGERGGSDFKEMEESFEKALDNLREAAVLENISQGLIARAEFHRVSGNYTRGHFDLDRAMRSVTRGSMRLLRADCLLEQARLYLAEGNEVEAGAELSTAKAIIKQTGYHRRDKDVKEIEEALAEN